MIPFSKVSAYLFSYRGYRWYVVTIHISAIVHRKWSKDPNNILVIEMVRLCFNKVLRIEFNVNTACDKYSLRVEALQVSTCIDPLFK